MRWGVVKRALDFAEIVTVKAGAVMKGSVKKNIGPKRARRCCCWRSVAPVVERLSAPKVNPRLGMLSPSCESPSAECDHATLPTL